MIKIYVAGPLSAPALGYLENMRRVMTVSAHLFLMGMSPFCTALDYHYALMRPELEEPIKTEHFYKASIEWVGVSDAILVLPNWRKSKGTLGEIEEAVKTNVPVFHTPRGLLNYFCFPPDPTLDVLWEKWEAEPVL